MKHPGYPLFTVKVPKNLGFVTIYPADEFYLRFEDIFELYHMQLKLHPTIVRLFALHMADIVIKEQIPGIAIADPYYMQEIFMVTSDGRDFSRDYMQDFMVKNKDKDIMLVPCFIK